MLNRKINRHLFLNGYKTQQDRQCTYNVSFRRVRPTIVTVEKQWLLQSLSVSVALGTQHAMRMRHIVIWSARLYRIFPNFLINGTILEKKKFLNTKYVFWFSLQVFSETFLILRRNERDMIKMYVGLRVKHSLFFSDFNQNWNFSTDFGKIIKHQLSWKSL
jgi:hypothetical protein